MEEFPRRRLLFFGYVGQTNIDIVVRHTNAATNFADFSGIPGLGGDNTIGQIGEFLTDLRSGLVWQARQYLGEKRRGRGEQC